MEDIEPLIRRGLALEYITLWWNVAGAGVVTVAALSAHSSALSGFALDSLIEIGASAVVIWHLRGIHDRQERRALRLIAVAFFALALYISGQSVRTLLLRVHPAHSPLGILWLSLTFVAMLSLAAGKHRIGVEINNTVLQTEARVTLVDAFLAGSVLLSLILNSIFGLWWTDSVAGFVIVFYDFREGVHAWLQGEAE
jgi:divalent metal cation (Fe/Co/Zn/Cd) transporter